MAGCGATSTRTETAPQVRTEAAAVPRAHPHVLEPVAGSAPAQTTASQTTAQTPAGPAVPSSDPRPTGPATVTKAPAKGAPTDTEIRAAFARFHAAVSLYHLNRLNFSNVVIDPAQL